MSHEFPLEGIRVVDASQGIAGPSAGMLLAQYGADVIKVEPREGDWSRSLTAGASAMTSMAIANNLGKRSIAFDLKHPQGAQLLRQLASRADVFIENFRTGVMERLGFDYARMCAYNPNVVYLSVTGFGQRGPMRQQPATDAILQAFSGMMGVNKGREDGLPHRLECWPVDIASGVYAFQAVAMALYARRDSGRGRYIDASLLQGSIGLQTVRVVDHVLAGGASAGGGAFPVGTFRTADGWVNLSVLKDALWPPFCRMIGRPDMADDPSLATLAGRRARAAEVMQIANEVFCRRPTEHWCAEMRAAGILNERVNTYDDMLAHPQTEAVGLFTWSEQAAVGRVPHPNLPGVQPLEPDTPRARAPRIGEHTRVILAELGYDEAAVRRLLDQAVVFEPAQAPAG
ncbi:MAG: CoA transferase [Burkholderiales bacterium]|nr:CoA transferase [Burkholderiales bacterium]